MPKAMWIIVIESLVRAVKRVTLLVEDILDMTDLDDAREHIHMDHVKPLCEKLQECEACPLMECSK